MLDLKTKKIIEELKQKKQATRQVMFERRAIVIKDRNLAWSEKQIAVRKRWMCF